MNLRPLLLLALLLPALLAGCARNPPAESPRWSAEQAALLHGTPHRTHAAPTPVVVAPRSLPAAH